MKRITNEELIENLKDLHNKLGRVPKKKDLVVIKGSKYGSSAYVRAFGNIQNAIVAAGFRPHQRRGLSIEKVLDDIKRVYKLLGHTPTRNEYIEMNDSFIGYSPIKDRFGSWTKALMAAGIPIINAGKVDKIFILQELKKWYIKNNCDVNCLAYWTIRKAKAKGKFPFSCATIKNHFPNLSWQETMQQVDQLYETKDPFIRRVHHIGIDSNKYLSLLEWEAGNILYNFKNTKQIKGYEYEKLVCEGRSWTCDFVIKTNDDEEIWLEIDGMRRNRTHPYKSGKNKKIQYYIDNNINYKIISYNHKDIKKSITILLGFKNIKIANKTFNSFEITDNFIFFTREEVYKYHMKYGQDAVISDLVLPFYNFIVQYVDKNDWIYPDIPNNYENIIDLIRSKDGLLNSSDRVGNQFIKSHFKSIWHSSNKRCDCPVSLINDIKIMMPIMKYRFGINNSKKYNYKFDNKVIEFNELFDISLKQVRRALETNRYVVSLFKPLVAKYIYKKYGFNNMTVWDPCAGFGGRLLGFFGSFDDGTYIANEPNTNTFGELYSLSEKINVSERVKLSSKPIESADIPKVDLVFTCPPYDFKEHYCDEPTQSDVQYKTYDDWVNGFLTTLIYKSYLSLSPDGKCIIVFDQKNITNCINIANKIGFSLIDSIDINNSKTHLNPSSNSEKCLIFQKQS